MTSRDQSSSPRVRRDARLTRTRAGADAARHLSRSAPLAESGIGRRVLSPSLADGAAPGEDPRAEGRISAICRRRPLPSHRPQLPERGGGALYFAAQGRDAPALPRWPFSGLFPGAKRDSSERLSGLFPRERDPATNSSHRRASRLEARLGRFAPWGDIMRLGGHHALPFPFDARRRRCAHHICGLR
jgi:hypothetical protein